MALNDDRRDDARVGDADLDVAAVGADDALLDALGAGRRPDPAAPGDAELLGLLADWRASVGAAPLPALPSEREIAEALAENVTPLRRGWVRPGDHHHGRRPALWQAVTGAAAVAAVLVGGLSIAAHQSNPGDPLWGVNKSIFSDHAGDVELVSQLNDTLTRALDAARTGDRATAEKLLEEVSSRLGDVGDAELRVALMRQRDAIERDLSRVTPTSVPSPAPLPDSSQAPVPPTSAPVLTPMVPVPSSSVPPVPPQQSLPVIPVPLDGLRISSTLQIPIDPQRIQDFLSPTTGQAPQSELPDSGVQPTAPTSVPVSPPAPTPQGYAATVTVPAPRN